MFAGPIARNGSRWSAVVSTPVTVATVATGRAEAGAGRCAASGTSAPAAMLQSVARRPWELRMSIVVVDGGVRRKRRDDVAPVRGRPQGLTAIP